MKIAFCQATYIRDFEDTILCVERVGPNVDVTIIVYSQTLNDQQIKLLIDSDFSKKYNIVAVKNEFKDNLPEMRNAYIRKAVELGVDWCCVSDPDELYSEELAKNLRNIITGYDPQGYSLLATPVRDQCTVIEWTDDINLLREIPKECRETDYWKPLLIFKLLPGIRYEGIGKEKNVHENLVADMDFKLVKIPKQYYYVHKREPLKVWKSAARNMFIGGGGNNVGNLNILWTRLRDITDKLYINSLAEFEELIEKGIDIYTDKKEIKEQFNNWLIDALKCHANSWGTETRETAKLYFILHKDRIDQYIDHLLKNPPRCTKETMTEDFIVRTFIETLGRSPEIKEKDSYVENILEGRIEQEQLADIIRNIEMEKFII